MKANTKSVSAKYIFIDIVRYSKNRHIEAQIDIITELNKIVKKSIKFYKLRKHNVILIPTGDGVCISLLDIHHPFDIHLLIALKILELLSLYNSAQEDGMRKFQIRIGINENTDNLIIDINGKRNVAGMGINYAQRIMDRADAGNIFVGQIVFERLYQREKYNNKFKKFSVFIKHNLQTEVYQYTNPSISYINSEIPSSLRALRKIYIPKEKSEEKNVKFSKFLAYFIAHLQKNQKFIQANAGNTLSNYALFIAIVFNAFESVKKSEKGKFEDYTPLITGEDIKEQFNAYRKSPFELLLKFSKFIFESELKPFTGGYWNYPTKYFKTKCDMLEATSEALNKLKKEWPEIFTELLTR